MAGECSCVSLSPPIFTRELPVPPSGGCTMGGAGNPASPGAWCLMAVLLLLLRRPVFGLFSLVACLSACSDPVTAIEISLRLDDPVLVATDHVRVVLSSGEQRQFMSQMMPAIVRPGLTVSNSDVDGDGLVDVVVELGRDFSLQRTNHFRLRHPPVSTPIKLVLRAEAFDGWGNRFAQLGGASRDPTTRSVEALLTPNQQTKAPELVPACLNQCSDGTWHLKVEDAALGFTVVPEDVTAMAVGNLSGANPPRIDLVLSHIHEERPGVPNAGAVWLYTGGNPPSLTPTTVINGSQAGDQLGAALAIGDLDGDGADDLVIGAPGVSNGRGALYVLFGPTWPATIDLAASPQPANLAIAIGTNASDRLGVALALADVDADGKLDVLAGADGAAQVIALRAADLPRGGSASGKPRSLGGPPSSRFGATVAVLGGRVAIGAPADGGAAAGSVFLAQADRDFAAPGGNISSLVRWVGEGGGFGGAIQLADLDGAGMPSVIVAAPDQGTGLIYAFATKDATGEVPAARAAQTIRATAPMGRLGAALGRLPWPGGDALVTGAPSPLGTDPPAGAAFLLRAQTLRAFTHLQLGASGQPAAAALAGAQPGDRFGSLISVADFDGDGADDLAVATPKTKAILIFRGPLL
jgi:hypothetical protein